MRISTIPAIMALTVAVAATAACSGTSTSATAGAGSGAPSATAGAGAATAQGSSPTASAAAVGGGSSTVADACKLLSVAQAQSLVGRSYSSSSSQVLSPGVDQCTYVSSDDDSDLEITTYQPNSGVTWDMLNTVLSSVGTVTSVSGVGDKATMGATEIDVQAGSRLLAVEGAGGTVSGHPDKAIAVAKAVVAALG
ncbi:MAG TPA: hypothetical protein VGX23_09465 [Actinocrinis sp.]|nr:hypothetical protein [Actinocrinis sp.]